MRTPCAILQRTAHSGGDSLSRGFAVALDGGVATVIFSRAQKRNALTYRDWVDLGDCLAGLGRDPAVGVVVLRGSGDDAFCAGADISEFPAARRDAAQAAAYQDAVLAALAQLAGCPRPTVARIDGQCTGGGLELAACCDLRIAGADARFGLPIARIGVVVGWVELQRLAQLIGPAMATDLLLTGRLIGADEALRCGLVTRVHPRAELDGAVQDAVEQIRRGSPYAHRVHKRMLATWLSDPALAGVPPEERRVAEAACDSGDYQEGVRAFLEKRPPRFTGA